MKSSILPDHLWLPKVLEVLLLPKCLMGVFDKILTHDLPLKTTLCKAFLSIMLEDNSITWGFGVLGF